MQVLYVDIYFLINFTVDLMAYLLAARILHIKTSLARLMILSALGGISAILDVLFEGRVVLTAVSAVLFLLLCGIIISRDLSIKRRAAFITVFISFEMLIGGAVSFVYSLLDRYLGNIDEYIGGGGNRGALIFSLVILLAIGVLRLFIMVFSNGMECKSARINITVCGVSVECDALIDSGNLVKDPMNMNPVIFIKPTIAARLLPKEALELSELDRLNDPLRKRIRLVPVSRGGETHVLTGVLPDGVMLLDGGESINVTVAIDKEEGTFGGYEALLPSSVLI